MPDIGNSHVIEWYLWRCLCDAPNWSAYEFDDGDDFATERREGWTYDNP